MRICRRSSLSLGCIMALALPVANGQTPPPDRPASKASGDAALDALKAARAKGTLKAPSLPPGAADGPTSEAANRSQRRAFEALRNRRTDTVAEGRARSAQANGAALMAQEREAMALRLSQALGLEAPPLVDAAKATTQTTPNGWVPVLFASSSMPISTLRSYAAQLEKIGGVIAFRGMPGGLKKVAPMANLSARILRRDPGCDGPGCAMRDVQLIVDPILFRQHGVAQVPALGLLPGDPTRPYCEREEEGPASALSAHLVYGDAALSGLLEEYGRLGGKREIRDAQLRLGNQ